MAGLHCERRLWMLVNRPEDRREPSLAEQRRMDFGIEFGRAVTRLFRGGVEITADYQHPQEALDGTASLLQGDVTGVNYYCRSALTILAGPRFPLLRSSIRPKVTGGDRQLFARRLLAAGFFSSATRSWAWAVR